MWIEQNILPLLNTVTNKNNFSSMQESIRMSEIEYYLSSNNMLSKDRTSSTRKWIIIDDLNMSHFLSQPLKDRMICTSEYAGLVGNTKHNFLENSKKTIKDLIIEKLK